MATGGTVCIMTPVDCQAARQGMDRSCVMTARNLPRGDVDPKCRCPLFDRCTLG